MVDRHMGGCPKIVDEWLVVQVVGDYLSGRVEYCIKCG